MKYSSLCLCELLAVAFRQGINLRDYLNGLNEYAKRKHMTFEETMENELKAMRAFIPLK